MFNGKPINLVLWDTAGQEDYDKLRPLSYPQTDIFVLCYSTVGRDSFVNVEHKWLDEISKSNPGVPFVLAATKRDLREDKKVIDDLKQSGHSPITTEEGEALCKKIGACGFFESSALEGKGVSEIFATCISVVMNKAAAPSNGKKKMGFSSPSSSAAGGGTSTTSKKEDSKGKGKVSSSGSTSSSSLTPSTTSSSTTTTTTSTAATPAAAQTDKKTEKKPSWSLFGKKKTTK